MDKRNIIQYYFSEISSIQIIWNINSYNRIYLLDLQIMKGLTFLCNLFHGQLKLVTHESKNAENTKSGKERSQRVTHTQEGALLDEVVVELVVRTQSNHATKSHGVRVEHLRTGIVPHLWRQENHDDQPEKRLSDLWSNSSTCHMTIVSSMTYFNVPFWVSIQKTKMVNSVRLHTWPGLVYL